MNAACGLDGVANGTARADGKTAIPLLLCRGLIGVATDSLGPPCLVPCRRLNDDLTWISGASCEDVLGVVQLLLLPLLSEPEEGDTGDTLQLIRRDSGARLVLEMVSVLLEHADVGLVLVLMATGCR